MLNITSAVIVGIQKEGYIDMMYFFALLIIIGVIALIIRFRYVIIAIAALVLAVSSVIKFLLTKFIDPEDDVKMCKENMVELLLCLFFGWVGAHKFYRKNKRIGILYALTFGLFCVGWLGDLIQICVAYFGDDWWVPSSIFRKIGSYAAAFLCVLALGSCEAIGNPEVPETKPQETTVDVIYEPTETVVQTIETTEIEPTEKADAAPSATHTTEESIEPGHVEQSETAATQPREDMVWIPTNGGERYHSKSSCSGMNDPQQVPLSRAIASGFSPCKRCY